MVRGWLLRSGVALLLLPGVGGRSGRSRQRDREREVGFSVRYRRPPAASADPPGSKVRAQPVAPTPGLGGASRARGVNGGEPGTQARREPTGSPRRALAFGASAIFLGSREPSLPSPATSAAAAAEIFRNATAGVVISSPTDPDASRFGGEEEGSWGREVGRGRLGQVSVPAPAGRPNRSRAARSRRRRREGRDGDVRFHAVIRTTGAPGVGASGHRGSRLGPSSAPTPPRPSLSPSEIWGVSFSSPQKQLRVSWFVAGAQGRTHLASAARLSLCCGILRIFFLNSFPALYPSALSGPLPPPHPLPAPVPQQYLPQSSPLRRFLEHVQLLPASPFTSLLPKVEKASVQVRVRATASANCASAVLRKDPGLLETRALGERAPLLFSQSCFFLSGSSSALEAFAEVQHTLYP